MYRWVEHTAELELRLQADTEAGIFAEAVAALGELLGDDRGGEAASHDVAVEAGDRPALLAELITEVVFLAETEDFVPEQLTAVELRDAALRARVDGRRGTPPHLVKAVTYHGLELERHNGSWHARVVLDV